MTTSEAGIELIKRFEGFRAYAYRDTAGLWTIGYGDRAHAYVGEICTEEQADEWLREHVAEVERVVNGALHEPVTQNQFDALVSLAYNIGATNFRESTLVKLINQREYELAAQQFSVWGKSAGQVLPGLVQRRAAEAKLFLLEA